MRALLLPALLVLVSVLALPLEEEPLARVRVSGPCDFFRLPLSPDYLEALPGSGSRNLPVAAAVAVAVASFVFFAGLVSAIPPADAPAVAPLVRLAAPLVKVVAGSWRLSALCITVSTSSLGSPSLWILRRDRWSCSVRERVCVVAIVECWEETKDGVVD